MYAKCVVVWSDRKELLVCNRNWIALRISRLRNKSLKFHNNFQFFKCAISCVGTFKLQVAQLPCLTCCSPVLFFSTSFWEAPT